jgi:2,4-dienoyl-CoA reductase-like NADH-dependent reductase (Old Yellow Enzyme family)
VDAAFAHLLAPGRIGSMELRNRIVMSPMGDDLCNPDGTVSDTQLAYAEARARGGVALVMLGSVAVAHPAGTSNKCQTGISDDRFIPGLRRLAEAVHAHGARSRCNSLTRARSASTT